MKFVNKNWVVLRGLKIIMPMNSLDGIATLVSLIFAVMVVMSPVIIMLLICKGATPNIEEDC
jgi:hypothetical protein